MRDVEVLLQQSVKHLGLVGDVVKVKPGYARNFLFPHRLGVPATEDAKRQIARRAAKVREAEAQRPGGDVVLGDENILAVVAGNSEIYFRRAAGAGCGKLEM